MKPTPQTIQIFLPSGDPHGIRVAEITTRPIQVIEVPRSLLPEFLKMPQSGQVGVYFLVADSDERSLYVGQTGDLASRLKTHDVKKEFWERALVLVSSSNNLTLVHALYLEWHCLQEAKKAGRYADENGNSGTRPHVPEPLRADCLEIFGIGRILLSTLGHSLFDAVAEPAAVQDEKQVFHCRAGGVDGRGLLTNEGFVVLKGSRGRKDNSPGMTETKQRFRQRLLDTGVAHFDGDAIVFDKDHLFGSPSMAAVALLGRTSNGWKEWKTHDGVTLDELKRPAHEDEG